MHHGFKDEWRGYSFSFKLRCNRIQTYLLDKAEEIEPCCSLQISVFLHCEYVLSQVDCLSGILYIEKTCEQVSELLNFC